MRTTQERGELGLAVAMLRMVRGWERAELAGALGVSRSWIWEIELGRKVPSLRTLQRITAALGQPMSAVDETLALMRGLRGPAGAGPGRSLRSAGGPSASDAGGRWDGGELGGVLLALMQARLRPGAEAAGAAGAAGAGGPEGARAQRERAAGLWARLARYGRDERLALVRESAEFQGWALCERLCEESVTAGADDAAAALELAELAVAVADAGAGGEREWASLEGYAWAFVADARRVGGDLAGAAAAFERSRRLWQAGAAAGGAGPLDAQRLVELEASLRVDQRRQGGRTAGGREAQEPS